jgi:hypothetical protein
MSRSYLAGLALAVPAGLAVLGSAQAADPKAAPTIDCKSPDAPYKDYRCLDEYLGDGFLERMVNYYRLEMNHTGAPADPNAPPARRKDYQDAPATTPPFPFTEWPYGGATSMGVSRPNSADSPLMVALANTDVGKWMNAANIQAYGWFNGGGNISTNDNKPAGNNPAAYMVDPNSFQLDQAVIYVERVPDTVQSDHIDWGFRFSALYGENYRYTNGYGHMSWQFNGHNLFDGYDFPMVYGELFVPQLADGLLLRAGRFISLPDIEAQLAPNNYMYSHSLTYAWDNYTNVGLNATLALNKNWFLQLSETVGTEAALWHWGEQVPNPYPNVIFPGRTMLKDPGAVPSTTGTIRWENDNGWDSIYLAADAENSGTYGYNNLQWYGITWYHRINQDWHFSWETYTLGERNVLNGSGQNATANAIIANGGFPWTAANGTPFNGPNFAICPSPADITCTMRVWTSLVYLNWQFTPLDNLSLRFEFYNDMDAQRTIAVAGTRIVEFSIGVQHWLSPQIEFRPEVAFYRSLDAAAFNGNPFLGQPDDRSYAIIAAADLIWHF